MNQAYRPGAIGALMDEYERAASELHRLVERLREPEFVRIVDPNTNDDDCRSVQTIMSHVVSSGYGYASYIREALSLAADRPPKKVLSQREALQELTSMLVYTAQSLEGRWTMSDEEIEGTLIQSRWGVKYTLEQLLEHAIVHILRHRRQIERWGVITRTYSR